MDPHFIVTREEFVDVRMDLRRVQSIQHQQSERIRVLEKRHANDAALRSVWNSPFPSTLGGGTPQVGPIIMPSHDVFDDLDEQGQILLGSLVVDDEPVRRGAASRANSVRFDESALQSSSWAGSRAVGGESGPTRPSSGLGGHRMTERTLSHKSDGRHSSAGHSVHSGHSGRASSLGLDTNFAIGGHDDGSPLNIPEPPPGFFYIGSAPSIVRCWLTTEFTSSTVLFAAVCTGSQKSTVEYSLIKELKLVNNIHRDVDGVQRITLPVFLAEAIVSQANSRCSSSIPQLPSITASFEVTGLDAPEVPDAKRYIRVVIGSVTLRQHSADLMFSQNLMTLYGSDRDKLSVPFVRPEDDNSFMHLTTANMVCEKPRLNATAPEFVSTEQPPKSASQATDGSLAKISDNNSQGPLSPASQASQSGKCVAPSSTSESGGENDRVAAELSPTEQPAPARAKGFKESKGSVLQPEAETRRVPSVAIRTPWRQTAVNGGENGQRENAPLSGYQPPSRSGRMKILKPSKSSGSARNGSAVSLDPTPTPRSSEEVRRRSLATASPGETHQSNGLATLRWGDGKRSSSHAGQSSTGGGGDLSAKSSSSALRSVNNPLGSASAFSWIAQPGKPKTAAAAAAGD